MCPPGKFPCAAYMDMCKILLFTAIRVKEACKTGELRTV